MLTGYIKHKTNLTIAEERVDPALEKYIPKKCWSTKTRQNRAVNAIPYRADYFGHKLHIDQNEKLGMYSVTHVAAIDGHSRMIVSWTTMPVKNNLIIYSEVYR